MKRLLVFVFLLPIICISQYTAIPDQNFEQFLIDEGYDNVLDGQVLTSNIDYLTVLTIQPSVSQVIQGQFIYDLTGIEDFTSLTSFAYNYPYTETINLSNNTSLVTISIGGNHSLKNLILGNLTSLTTLNCIGTGQNAGLTSLDVSGCSSLTQLQCQGNDIGCLNLKNGNNANLWPIASMNALTCVEVDDPVWATSNWTTTFDANVYFSSNCNYQSNCFSTSSIVSKESNNLSIFPNPTNNLIQIEIENHNGSFEAALYDFTGKLLEATNKTAISLTDYPTGIYLLKVSYGDRIEEVKVVKE